MSSLIGALFDAVQEIDHFMTEELIVNILINKLVTTVDTILPSVQ